MRYPKILFCLFLINGTAALSLAEDASVTAARGLLERLFPTSQHRDTFEFEIIPQEAGKEDRQDTR
jgi:hypothetical protein